MKSFGVRTSPEPFAEAAPFPRVRRMRCIGRLCAHFLGKLVREHDQIPNGNHADKLASFVKFPGDGGDASADPSSHSHPTTSYVLRLPPSGALRSLLNRLGHVAPVATTRRTMSVSVMMPMTSLPLVTNRLPMLRSRMTRPRYTSVSRSTVVNLSPRNHE